MSSQMQSPKAEEKQSRLYLPPLCSVWRRHTSTSIGREIQTKLLNCFLAVIGNQAAESSQEKDFLMLFLSGGINSLGVDSAMLTLLLPFLRDGIDNDDNDDDGNNVENVEDVVDNDNDDDQRLLLIPLSPNLTGGSQPVSCPPTIVRTQLQPDQMNNMEYNFHFHFHFKFKC